MLFTATIVRSVTAASPSKARLYTFRSVAAHKDTLITQARHSAANSLGTHDFVVTDVRPAREDEAPGWAFVSKPQSADLRPRFVTVEVLAPGNMDDSMLEEAVSNVLPSTIEPGIGVVAITINN